MSECYDCGELFEGFGECPVCGSENVGVVEPDEVDLGDIDDSDDYYVDDDDENYN
jgi:Zn finger protein HypA/HybF involved in hydrogenase expression